MCLKGFSDSKTLGAGRLDVNIYMQNLHLLYSRLSSSSGELRRGLCKYRHASKRQHFRIEISSTKTWKVKL